MAKDKKTFMLYTDQRVFFDELPDELAGKLIKHLFAYVNDENPKEDLIMKLAFSGLKKQLKMDLKRYEKVLEGRSKAGKASAEARRIKKEQNSTNSTSVKNVGNISTNPTDKDKDKDIFININKFKERHLENEAIFEGLSKMINRPKSHVKDKLNDFVIECKASGKIQRSYAETSEHFKNWLKINKEMKKTNKRHDGSMPLQY